MDDMRDDINAALDEVETENNDGEESTPDTTPREETTDTSTDSGEADTTADTKSEEAPPPEKAAPEEDPSGVATATPDHLKAPISLTPKQREEWSKVPPQIQARFIEREKEMDTAMADTSSARKTHDRMSQLGQSYAQILAAEGVNDPVQAAEGLFNTVAQLRMGTQEQKAKVIAGLISNYGVDVLTLDNALAGTPQPAEAAPNAEVNRLIEEKMAPITQIMKLLDQKAQNTQAEEATQAGQTVEDFAKNAEFISDVRMDMADLIDAAQAKGQEMPLQRAYDMACALHPEISDVLAKRRLTATVTSNKSVVDSKRRAASSLNSRRSGATTDSKGLSLRDSIVDAMDAMH